MPRPGRKPPRFSGVFRENALFLGFFFIAACLFYYRIFAEGIVIVPGDALLYNYPLKVFYSNALKSGSFPLWNPYEYAGLPFIGLTQTGALYPINIVLYGLFSPSFAFNLSFLLHYALAGFFTFLYLRSVGLSRLSAFAGGFVFAFSGFVVSNMPNTAILDSAVWLPLIIFFLEKLRKSPPDFRYALALALAVAMQILAGGFQICVYTYMVAAFFLFFHVPALKKGERAGYAGLVLGGVLLGFAVASPQILAAQELGNLSVRDSIHKTLGYIFFREFSVYPKTLASLFFPFLFTGGEYGKAIPLRYDSVAAYAGAIPFVFSIVLILKDFFRNSFVRFWAFIAFLGLFLAAAGGTPAGKVLYYIPAYNIFRAHARNLFEFSFAVSALFAFGLDGLRNPKGQKYLNSLIVLLAAVLAFSLVFFGFFLKPELFPPGIGGLLELSNASIYVPLSIMAVCLVCLLAYRLRPGRAALYALVAVVCLEAYSYGGFSGISGETPEALSGKCGSNSYDILKGMSGEKVFRISRMKEQTYEDLYNVDCGIEAFNSYDPLMLSDYARLFDMDFLGYSRYWEFLLKNNTLLSMMNVRYLWIPDSIKTDYAGMTIPGAGKKTVAASVLQDKSVYFLSRRENTFSLGLQLEKGTYLFSFRAMAQDGRAALRMEVFDPASRELRHDIYPLNVYPGVIGPEPGTYYRIVPFAGARQVTLYFESIQGDPVKIRDISIRRLGGYGPPAISAGAGNVYERIFDSQNGHLVSNRNALPQAYSVSRIEMARDIDDVKRRFDFERVNPAETALLYPDDFKAAGAGPFANGKVSVAGYHNNWMALDTGFPSRGFVVVSEQYYPGWRAYVDGKETRIYKVDGVLRGVVVPAGRHRLLFRYRPVKILVALAAGVFISAGILSLLVFRSFNRGGKEKKRPDFTA
ncbi:MAG: YfhO family protein [Nitrospiraceae bacterium]|nr:YfhO family protein [Nitrospiraceae bacterium]